MKTCKEATSACVTRDTERMETNAETLTSARRDLTIAESTLLAVIRKVHTNASVRLDSNPKETENHAKV